MTRPEQHANTVREQEFKNTDRELWREIPEGESMSYYSPSIHVTEQGGIGINVGGTVYVRTLREWHALAERADTLERERDEAQRGLLLVHQMACYGPSDDTSRQETLSTIAAFVAKRLGL